MTVTYRAYTVDLLASGPLRVLAVVSLAGQVVHSDSASSEEGALEAARRWIDQVRTTAPAPATMLAPAPAGPFSATDLVAVNSSGWVLADNTDLETPALGIVTAADELGARVATGRGAPVYIAAHGLGSAGDRLWLGTVGGTFGPSTSGPTGSARVFQEVLFVVDSDWLILFPESPQRI